MVGLCHRRMTSTRITSSAIVSDGIAVTGDADGGSIIWSFDSNAPRPKLVQEAALRSWTTYYHGITTITISPDLAWLFMGSDDKTGILWQVIRDPDSVTAKAFFKLRSGEGEIICSAFSPDGRLLAVGDEAGASVWLPGQIIPSSRKMYEEDFRLETRDLYYDATCVAFLPDSRSVVVGYSLRQIRVWNITSSDPTKSRSRLRGVLRSLLIEHPEGPGTGTSAVEAVAASPSGTRLLSACGNGTVVWWDVTPDEISHSIMAVDGHATAVGFDTEATGWVAWGTGALELWDWTSKVTIRRSGATQLPEWGDHEYLSSVTKDGTWALALGHEGFGSLALWRLRDVKG